MAVSQQVAGFSPAQYGVSWIRPGSTLILSLTSKEVEIQWVVVKANLALGVKDVLEDFSRFLPGNEKFLIGNRLELIAGRDHAPFHSHLGYLFEHLDEVVFVKAVEHGGVGSDSVPLLKSTFDASNSYLEHTLAVHGLVVGFLHSVKMNDKAKVLGGRYLLHHALHKQSVSAHIYKLLLSGDAVDDLVNMRMERRLSSSD